MVPSFIITKDTRLRPCFPSAMASFGYFTVLLIYARRACMPPGYCGNTSEMEYTPLASGSFFTVFFLACGFLAWAESAAEGVASVSCTVVVSCTVAAFVALSMRPSAADSVASASTVNAATGMMSNALSMSHLLDFFWFIIMIRFFSDPRVRALANGCRLLPTVLSTRNF